jgi:uncharacterized membrane protein
MTFTRCFHVGLVITLIVSTRLHAASFQGLGDLPGLGFESYAYDISADGSAVVGASAASKFRLGYRWTEETGMVSLFPSDYSDATGISADGTTIVGLATGEPVDSAFAWTEASGPMALDVDPDAYSSGVSADGAVAVGSTYHHGAFTALRWKDGVSIHPCPGESDAYAASADGSVVVGVEGSIVAGIGTVGTGFRWREGIGLDNPFPAAAFAISYDGSVVGGELFRWTQSGGIETISGNAYDLSADGSVMVGKASDGGAFIWDAAHGMRDLQSLLENDHGLDLTGWTLTEARCISANGLVIAGTGTNPLGDTEAWRATVPEPTTITLLAMGGLALGVLSLTRRKKGGRSAPASCAGSHASMRAD